MNGPRKINESGTTWTPKVQASEQRFNICVKLDEKNFTTGHIGKQKLPILIDSGADQCTISSGMIKKIFPGKQPEYQQSPYACVVMADGRHRVQILGSILLNTTLAGHSYQIRYHVKETDHEIAIIGNSFLRATNAKLEFASGILYLSPSCYVRATRSYNIGPFQSCRIDGHLTKMYPEGTIGVTHDMDQQNVTCNFETEDAVCRVGRQHIPVCVTNPYPFTVNIPKQSKVARFDIMSADMECIPLESEKAKQIIREHRSDVQMKSESDHVKPSAEEFIKNFNINNPKLSDTELQEVKDLIWENKDVFFEYDGQMGHYTEEVVKIELKEGAHPSKKRPYRVHPRFEDALEKEIKDLKDQGVIEDSYSEWASPAVVVEKKGKQGQIRLVVDFRGLNDQIRKDHHPLPRIEDTFNQIGTAKPKFFSSLDLQSGYFQLSLAKESRDMTTFCTPRHSLRFTRVPQGLCISGARFQRVMNRVFMGCTNRFVQVYLDDIMIYSNNFKQHLEHLGEVFQRIRQANLKVKAKKCTIMADRLPFLGFILSTAGVEADPRLCQTIRNFPKPKNLNQTRRFLGIAQYYRKFIQQFSSIARPLHNLSKKNQKFLWTSECETAFLEIKNSLCTPPVLVHADFDRPFILTTDSSDQAAGFCLSQKDDNGNERVISYGGRSYLPYQTNYGVTEKEMLAVYLGVTHYDYYLRHNKFTVITDHSALTSLLARQKELKGKFARWAAELLAYRFDIKFRKGSLLVNADALSRIQHNDKANEDPNLRLSDITCQSLSCDETNALINDIDGDKESQNSVIKLIQSQEKDPVIALIRKIISSGRMPNKSFQDEFGTSIQNYFMDNNILYFYEGKRGAKPLVNHARIVITDELWPTLLKNYHEGIQGMHMGTEKTLLALANRYYWPWMAKHVLQFVDSCITCQQYKSGVASKTVPLELRPEPSVGELTMIDICGPIKETDAGFKHILCVSDYASRYTRLTPLKDTKATSVARALFDSWICVLGAPSAITSDRGSAFTSEIMRELCRFYAIEQSFSCSFVSRSHGLIERQQRFLQETLRYFLDQYSENWDMAVQAVGATINATVNKSTGYSPNVLMLGRELPKLIDGDIKVPPNMRKPNGEQLRNLLRDMEVCRDFAKKTSELQRGQYAKYFNRRAKTREFDEGDTVYLYFPKARPGFAKIMTQVWHGPYIIVEKVGTKYKIKNCENNKTIVMPIHPIRLKRAIERRNWKRPPGLNLIDNNELHIGEDCLPKESFRQTEITGSELTGNITSEEDNTTYTIERIIHAKYFDNGLKYLVKWTGYTDDCNSYVTIADLNKTALDYIQNNDIKTIGRKKPNGN